MNTGQVIWAAYSRATRWRVLLAFWQAASLVQRSYILLLVTVITGALGLFVAGIRGFWLNGCLLVAACASVTLYILAQRAAATFLKKDCHSTQIVLEQGDWISARYLYFRDELRHHDVDRSEVRDYFEQLYTQLDIAKSPHSISPQQGLPAVFVLMVSAVLVAFWNHVPSSVLAKIFIPMGLIGVLIWGMSRLFPSRERQLHQLKDFMQRYCKEIE